MESGSTSRRVEKNRRIVMLTIAESCNLDCLYCYEQAKTPAFMDLQVAKEVIEHEFANSRDFDEIEFDLFGGEPTLRKDFIVELVEWTIGRQFAKPFLFFIQTNGTLVHGSFQEWLIKNKTYVYVGLSLDGTPETHNHNRSGSYNQIDLGFFLAHYQEQGARMTVNNATAHNLSNDIIHLHNLGFNRIDAYFAYGVDWLAEGTAELLARELRKLCDFYLGNPQIKECSLFDMHLPRLIHNRQTREKWCGTGTQIVSVGVDGKRYPCQTFQPNTNPHPVELGGIDFNAITDFGDPECGSCAIEALCPSCYGINHLKTGNLLTRDKSMCRVTKLRALAVSYLRGMQIRTNASSMTPPEVYQNIRAIGIIQKQLHTNNNESKGLAR